MPFALLAARRGRPCIASRRRLKIEPLEPRVVLDAQLAITELMAVNAGSLADEDGEYSDWIEIFNLGDLAADLDGYYLTDDGQDPTKWRFPAQTLDPGDYLVVFASGKDRAIADQPLHTNFQLNGDGEFLGLYDGTSFVSQFAPGFPRQVADVSFGLVPQTESVPLLAAGAGARLLVPTDPSELADDWAELETNDDTWTDVTTGIGFDTSGAFDGHVATNLQAAMLGNNASAFLRVPFNVDDPTRLDGFSMRMKYDDGFIAYLNGTQVAHRNALGVSIETAVGSNGAFSVADDDLIENGQPSLASIQLTGGSAAFGSSVAGLNNGTVYADGAFGNTEDGRSLTPSDGTQVVVTLDTAASPQGYDVGAIVSLTGGSQNRLGQVFDVELSYVGSDGFELLAGDELHTVHRPLAIGNAEHRVTLSAAAGGLIASGVDQIRWTFFNAQAAGGESMYREIDVFAEPLDTGPTVGAGDFDERFTDTNQIRTRPFGGYEGDVLAAVNFHHGQAMGADTILGIAFDDVDLRTNTIFDHGTSASQGGGELGDFYNLSANGTTATMETRFGFLHTTSTQTGTVAGTDAAPANKMLSDVHVIAGAPRLLDEAREQEFTLGNLPADTDVFVQLFGGDAGWQGDTTVIVNGQVEGVWNVSDGNAGTNAIFGFFTRTDAAGKLDFDLDHSGVAPAFAGLSGFLVTARGEPVDGEPVAGQWNQTALAERPDALATQYETIDVSRFRPLLQPGPNVLAIHGLNVAPDDADFLLVPELDGDVVSGLGTDGRYFPVPTPGATNVGGVIDFVADTRFSADRGFYGQPLDVEITTATPGATIAYTVDGSEPALDNGTVVAAPDGQTPPTATVYVAETTTLRAAAFKTGYEPTNVDTQTYLFLEDIVRQDYQATLDAGFPSTWITTTPDYGIDPDVAGQDGEDLFGGVYTGSIRDDLKSIPTMSIVMDVDDLFGSSGIYSNPLQRGIAWERAASVEYFDADGTAEFQIDAGIRIQGGASRNPEWKKHSFRLLFKQDYGPTKLEFPLFGPDAADRFDTITLRANVNDNWLWSLAGSKTQYTRDEFIRRSGLAMGKPEAHGTFVHLYVNGVYWGLYNPVERPDGSFAESYFGGDKDEWDVINHSGVASGDANAWNTMLSLAADVAGAATEQDRTAAFQRIQGNNPDGTNNPDWEDYLDVDDLIDYMIVNLYGGNVDWPQNNYYTTRLRGLDSTGFKFFSWDAEYVLGLRSDLYTDRTGVSGGVAEPYARLLASEEFRLLFADHVQRHFSNGGALTPEATTERFQQISDEVDRAVVGESARWGDRIWAIPKTRDADWVPERDSILNTFLPLRSDVVLDQFRTAGLYPEVNAPAFFVNGTQQHGGVVGTGDQLDLIVPDAEPYIDTNLLVQGAPAYVHYPLDSSLGMGWTARDYTLDAAWTDGTAGTGVGYDANPDYDDRIGTEAEPEMLGRTPWALIRTEFEYDGVTDFDRLLLNMQYDDGFIAYLNGTEVARSSNVGTAVTGFDATIQQNHEATGFEEFDVTEFKSLLVPGTNVLAVHGINVTTASSDFLILPELVGSVRDTSNPTAPVWFTTDGTDPRAIGGAVAPSAIAYTGPFAVPTGRPVRARALVDGQWSALNAATFLINPATGENLAVSEIMYNPAPPTAAELAMIPTLQNDDFEFIELLNTSPTDTIDLTGVRFVDGVDFAFSPETAITALAPGDRALVVRNAAAMAVRYGADIESAIAGQYAGGLKNGGETVRIEDAAAALVVELTYKDGPKWPQAADGGGSSLEAISVGTDLSEWESWYDSVQPGGSPGVAATAAVVARYVYYAGSALDDGTPAGEDRSIATDTTALLPGQTATFGNYTNFGAGLTGVMVDLAHAPDAASLAGDDFTLLVGNDGNPSAWTPAATPVVTVRPGEGRGGSDRVVFTWPIDAPTNTWLQVTSRSDTPNTGLIADDVFYFGNAVGETGNSTADALVNAADVIAIRDNPRGPANPAPIDSPYDVNRDMRVDALDLILARDNATSPFSALRLIALAEPGAPAAPSGEQR